MRMTIYALYNRVLPAVGLYMSCLVCPSVPGSSVMFRYRDHIG